ncbi:MAG: RIP metalloprotease RseP, partial [FCB group bacterium]|nr:RIP metalloprotease RseP [FCB group bacterium]
MITALSTIFVLGVLIFFHELGHFLVAKKSGIRVERFSLGFPPSIVKKKFGDTEYCIGLIPLGGYVKMT